VARANIWRAECTHPIRDGARNEPARVNSPHGVGATSRFAVIRDRSRRKDEGMANQNAALMVSPKIEDVCAHNVPVHSA
jgi:hypothetical protein